jgi:hypothetical protein
MHFHPFELEHFLSRYEQTVSTTSPRAAYIL